MQHEEVTSSFVQYDVGNFILVHSYCAPLVLSKAVCCVEVFTELSRHDVGCCRRHRTSLVLFLLYIMYMYVHTCTCICTYMYMCVLYSTLFSPYRLCAAAAAAIF